MYTSTPKSRVIEKVLLNIKSYPLHKLPRYAPSPLPLLLPLPPSPPRRRRLPTTTNDRRRPLPPPILLTILPRPLLPRRPLPPHLRIRHSL